MMVFRTGARLGLLSLFCLSLGCGGAGLAPVKGQFFYPDGSPATGMEGNMVIFEATGADGKKYSSVGTLDASGRFELMTEKAGDGAPIGKNQVLIERRMIDSERQAPRVIDAKYEKIETSGLEVEVVKGTNDVKLTVEPIKKNRE